MIIFPAIDLYTSNAVRLLRGDYNNMTIYSSKPTEVARKFKEAGAEYIHVVDLEGAHDGGTPNFNSVIKIKRESGLFVEVGGGIRDMKTVDKYLSSGIDRVILGTAAVNNLPFLVEACKKYGPKIAVGADIKNGFIAVKGWTESSGISVDSFFFDMIGLGIKNIICTDIAKDGAMAGTNLELYKKLSEKYNAQITASGGVSSIEDIVRLREMNLYGAIVGKAYYTGKVDLREAIEKAK